MPNPSNPYADLLPSLPDDEYQRLKDDIAENGVLVPIIVDDDGNILDGRHRWAIAAELGIDCPIADPMAGLQDYEKRLLAVSVNVRRRHLTDAQATLLGDQIKPDIEAKAKERMMAGQPSGKSSIGSGTTRDEVAETVGLGSGRSYENHSKVLAELADDHPDLHAAAIAGEIETDDGKTVKADMKALRKQLNTRKAKAKQAEIVAAQDFIPPQLTVMAAADWLAGLQPRSADLLITDPPYATDVDDIAAFAASWVDLALNVVKPTGRAYICTGAYPQELHAYLNVLLARSDMTVANVLAWHYPDTLGPSPKLDYKASWQAIYHLRGPDAPELNTPILTESTTVQTVNMNSGIIGARVHSWQKPDALAERLIQHATQPGDTIIDCFAGTGTFLVAAGRLGRHAYGCELNPDMAALAAERGCHVD